MLQGPAEQGGRVSGTDTRAGQGSDRGGPHGNLDFRVYPEQSEGF